MRYNRGNGRRLAWSCSTRTQRTPVVARRKEEAQAAPPPQPHAIKGTPRVPALGSEREPEARDGGHGHTHDPPSKREGDATTAPPSPAERRWRRNTQIAARTKKVKRRQPRTQKADLVCVTQNAQGLAKNHANFERWFDGLRQRTQFGQPDVVFLQETRATKAWVEQLTAQHARGWGLRPDRLDCPISLWSETPTAAGGVAILFRPDSRLKNPRPLWKEHWSPWFMAAVAELNGASVTLINVYGPSGGQKKARERLFHRIRSLEPPQGRVLLGGDFNCMLNNELDRSSNANSQHGSPELQLLLEQDATSTDAERREFHAAQHTYRYKTRAGDLASSRLDRWYVSQEHVRDIRRIEVTPPAQTSDHDAVTLVLVMAPDPTWKSKRRNQLRYPLPLGSQEAVQEISQAEIDSFSEASQTLGAAAAASAWDKCKDQIRQLCLREIRARLKTARRAFQQRRKRLGLALRAALRIANPPHERPAATAMTITQGMSELSLDPAERVLAIRRSISRLHKGRARRRRRARAAIYLAGTIDAERAFFKRFSARQGRQHVAAPQPEDGSERSPASRIADDWRSVTQRAPTDDKARTNSSSSSPSRRQQWT